ncbi:MAG: amidohydrolase [Ginsengibacter sp.]
MKPLTITIVQTGLHWEDKRANLSMLENKLSDLPAETQIVILPEMFSTGFSMNTSLAEKMNGKTVNWMKDISTKKKIILAGSVIIEENEMFYNRLLYILPNGEIGTYDKRHLFAFANENLSYTAGKNKLITTVNGWKINWQICYDLRFPVWARQSSEDSNTYDLLINVANWPSKRIHAWKSLLTARAIENQSYVIGVNRTGDDGNSNTYSGNSMVVDPLGEVIYDAGNKEELFTITFVKEKLLNIRQHFPFLNDRDSFEIKV